MKTFRVHYAIIHGEYSYREWIDVEAADMDFPQAASLVFDELASERLLEYRQEIIGSILSEGSAMIPVQDRTIMNIRWEEVKPIVVTVYGGVVQDISDIPEGVTVKVVDWNNDEVDVKDNPVPSVGIWDSRGRCRAIEWDGEQ